MENYPKFFRPPWNAQKVDELIKFWPHWGTEILSERLQISWQQAKSKADKLKLKMLPKKQRLCFECQTNFQITRRYGLRCRECALKHRIEQRKLSTKPREQWIADLLRTLRYRSKEPCSLDIEYLVRLWDLQNGCCIYSGYKLREPVFYGRGRDFKSASLDRIDSSRGYIKGNVVWAAWGCNIAKQDFPVNDYLGLCATVSNRTTAIHALLASVQSAL